MAEAFGREVEGRSRKAPLSRAPWALTLREVGATELWAGGMRLEFESGAQDGRHRLIQVQAGEVDSG